MDLFERLTQSPVLRASFAARRLLRGPKRPSWSLEMEIASEFMRLYGPVLTRLSPANQRKTAEGLLQPTDLALETPRDAVDFDGVSATWFKPRGRSSDAVIYYLHGGGYILGSMHTHQNLISGVCKAASCDSFALDYRLAPEHPFPAAIEDSVAGYRHLLNEGIAPDRIVIAGDSAGGGLALATLFQLRDLGLPLPASAVLISPWADIAGSSTTIDLHSPYDYIVRPHLALCAEWLLAGQDPKHPLASPVHGDFKGLPPLLIQVGGAEALLDDAVRVASRAREAGVDVRLDVHNDMVHVFHIFMSFLPEAQRAVHEFGAFVRSTTGARVAPPRL